MASQGERALSVVGLSETAWVLSVYFDVDASKDPWGEKLQHLRDVLDACERQIEDKRVTPLFLKGRRWMENHIADYGAQGRCVALFFAPETEQAESVVVQARVPNGAYFRKGPYTEPLAGLQSASPRIAIVHVDNEHGRIVVTHAGEIISTRDVEDDVPKRHKQTEHDSRQERAHAEKVRRHLKRVAGVLLEMRRAREFDYMLLGGASEALPKFYKELPAELAQLVKGTFSAPGYATDAQLVQDAVGDVPKAA